MARSILDTNVNNRLLSGLITHDLPPSDELLKFQDGSILTYHRAKSEDVKSLSDEAFNLLLSQDDNNEKTGYFAYNILRYSNKKAELDYVSSLGAMNNRFRLDAQKYGGKLYKMAEPYLNKNPARKTTPVTQPESKPTPVASTSSSDLGDNKVEPEAKQQPAKEEAPKQETNSKTPTLDKHNALMDSVHDSQANEDKPKFIRKATESDSVPIYRIDNKNFDANNIKPHGLYVSIPSDASTFDSPHKDVGDTSFAGNASPKNPLNVESFKIQHKRGNDYPMEVSAGVSALKQLVSVQLFERLIKADKAELTATIKEQFPDIDTSQYYDAYELLEVLGAQLAIQEGYDAIIQKNGNDQFNEMVILDNSIIDSMSPTDKPKNSRGTGEGLTTTQTRAILVKRFGEKLIKALESSGLLKILETMGDIPSQALKSIQAWHGSPHKFNSFSLAHLGSGEGNQAYGWGLYFAASKEVAEWYRTVLSEQQGKHRTHVTYDGIAYEFSEGSEHEAQALIRALVSKGHTFRDSLEALMELRKYPRLVEARKAFTRIVDGDSTRYTEAEIAKEDKFTKEVILKPRRILKILNEMSIDEGQLYKVDIDVIEDGLLLWDVSFEEQPKVVQQALLALGYKPKAKTKYLSLEEDGGSIYRDLTGTLGGQKEASLALKKNGVDGIKYLDGGSRQAGEGNYNYVVFDDAAVDIVETFYSENPNGIEGYYHNGQATLIADNLTPETVVATFVHELGGHKGFQELMTPTAYASLMRQFNRLVKQGNAIALAAKARAEAAEVVTPTADTKEAIALAEKQTLQRQQDELLPYLLTLQATLNATRSQQSAVTKVIEQVYRAVKAWLYRTLSAKGYDGLASKLLQPKDITLLAERMIREMGGDLSGKTPNELQERRAMIQGLSFMGAASALGGGITLVDMSMKARDAKKIIDDILTKGKEGITPSKEFLAVIEKMANAKESVAARKRAASIVEGFITKLRGELLENSQLSGKIAINAKNIKTGEAIFIDAKDAHHESKRMFDAMTEQRKKIESQIVLAASMVESITGYKLNDLVIIPKPDSTIELLVGKQLTDGWREFGFVGASTEWQEGIKINVNAQTLIDLASGSSVIRAGAFSLIAHEMTHAIQHQLLPLNTRDSKVLGVDTFIPDGISAMHKAWLSENSNKYSSQEDSANYKAEKEGFDVGYTAAKAMLKKEGLPLRIISERDLENALLTAAQDTTSTEEALDKFNKANYSDDIRFSQLNTPQTQINAVRKKYEGTSQWMKAPNGQPTKLNEMQWLQVRTPNFKAWFGSWLELVSLNNLVDNFSDSNRGEMFSSVVSAIGDSQILDSVISSIPIDVMNNLGGKKLAIDMLLNNPSMFIDVLSPSLRNPNVFSAFNFSSESVIALTRAKLSNSKPTSSNAEIFTALHALQNNLITIIQTGISSNTRVGSVHPFSSARSSTKALSLGLLNKFTRAELANHINNLIEGYSEDYTTDQSALKQYNASKVVDSNGEPMVVYHGTPNGGFTEFSESKKGTRTSHAAEDVGFHFTDSVEYADTYSLGYRLKTIEAYRSIFGEEPKAVKMPDGSSIYPVFLNIVNPVDVGASKLINAKLISQSQNKGHDGIVADIGGDNEFVAFDPTQIKSAIGNNGEFSQTNPDIRFSRKAKNPITEGIKSAANDAKNSLPDPIAKSIDNFMAGRKLPSSDMANITAKTELSLYHRTIGTQQNTALQNADFKKVYDIAQRYLQHVAVDAYAALKVAPNLLGKLESWSDLKKDVKKIWPANFIKQKADRAAVASIIFDETLNNELLSDADILKALTRDQRKIYKEARDAIQVSLENTAKSEMVRKLLAAEAINWQTVESLINQDLPVEQFAQTVRDMVESRIGGFKNELEAILDANPKIKEAFKTGNKNKLIPAQKKELKKALTLKAQIETTEEALKSLNDVEARLETLIEQGYAPLMRFGEYTLTVRDLDGKVKSFFMFESKAEQVRATNAIVARYGKTVNLETDMISKEEFKQFAGMTPETVALFAKETGMDKDEAYQHYLKHAIPARSAMTRMIKRKGTEGFSDDIQRVVASFVMSNARMSAKNIYAAQIEKSIQAIESGKSVKDQAYVMKENVFNPKENFAQLRNFLFLWNLGGSIFFGLLNMTQPYMQTLPHLSQYVPIKEAFYAIIKGSGIAGSAMKNGTAPKGYEAEYNRAVREGVVDPQNVFMLSGVERGKTGASNSAWGVITHTMGLIAQVTESFNRKAVFIAALEVANKKGAVWLKKKGFNSAYDFAKDTVDQTQGVYDKANRSNWANTSVGAPLMVFKQFSINYVEQMVRMWKKEAASGDEGKKAVFLMLALLASLSGVMGLPFIKDILDVSETTAAFLGNPVNIEREARLALGKDLADPLFNGVLNHFVFNNLGMDIQGRTGMPDLVPWSNALNPTLSAQGRINEFASIAGATGGLIEKGYDATQLIARGNIGTAALTLMPRSITSAFTGGKMAVTDEVMDSKGNKLFDTTWDEGLVKFIDANPKRMADLSRTKSLEWKDKSIQAYMTTNFKQKIIAAMMDNDQAEVTKLNEEGARVE